MSDNKIPLAAVVGSPIAHSRSPQLHNYWLSVHRVRGHYVPMDVSHDNFDQAIRILPELGFVGCNITIPYKERVMALADQVTDRATLIGAANTLIFRRDGRILADNTDGYGFIENLRQGAPSWQPGDGKAVVLGAGGAARAVVAALADAGVSDVLITNRTRVRAERLKEDFGQRVSVVDWVQAGNILEEASLIVNTTSLGMTGKPEMRVPLDGLRAGTVVTDLVYEPLQTRLLREAHDAGCITVDGLGMLLHQAVPCFERWFGHRPVVDDGARTAALK